MRKIFLLAVGLVLGLASSQALSPSHAAYYTDQDVYDAIARAQSISVADANGPACQYPCFQPVSTIATNLISTPAIETNSIVVRQFVDSPNRVSMQIGDQLELPALSGSPSQEEINATTLLIRDYLIDRGLAVEAQSLRASVPTAMPKRRR
jgi:hypothetical protein